MAITIEDVEHVAKLARLALTGEEKELLRRQLSDVLEHAEDYRRGRHGGRAANEPRASAVQRLPRRRSPSLSSG